ncbi:MAG: hypothetical protein II797_00155, partial [Clostridia bacterium]|nr:hypothetical protein [Clostridia bacterium]
NTLIYAVPGMWICLSALSMWAAAKLVRRGIMRCGAHDIFFYKNWNIMVPAGWVFAFIAVTVAALVIAFLPESENKLRYSAILFNFSSVIELPLLGIGFRRARITLRKLKTLRFPFPIWVIVLLFVLVTICQPSLSLVALTCIGAWYILKRYLDKKKKSPPEDPSDGPSDDRTES